MDFREIALFDLAVVHGYNLTAPYQLVRPAVFGVAAERMGMGILEDLVLAPAGGVADVGHVGVVAGAGEDLVQVGDVETVHRPFPFDYIDDAGFAYRGDARRFPAPVLEGAYEGVGVVKGVGDAETAVVANVVGHVEGWRRLNITPARAPG